MISLFSQNNLLKILSVALAVLLWLFVTGEEENTSDWRVSRTFNDVDLSVRNQDPSLVLLDEPGNVAATIRGDRTMISRVAQDDLMFYVDLEGLGPGEHQVPVESSIPQFEVVDIEPRYVDVELDEVEEQTFVVEPELLGEPAGDLSPQTPIVTPATVSLSGASSILETVDRVVVSIDMEGATTELEKGLVVDILNEEGESINDIGVNPGMVEVVVPMDFPETELAVDVVIEEDPGGEFADYSIDELQVSPDSVIVEGLESVLEDLEGIDTEPISLRTLVEEEEVVAPLHSPPGVEGLSETEVTVSADLSIEEDVEAEQDGDEVDEPED